MAETEQVLLENAKEYFKNAVESEKREEFNTAVTLYFKTLSALSDLLILKKEGHTPSSHTNRFRILETKFPSVYNMIDKDLPFYQDSYRIRLTKETADILKEDVKKLSKIIGIEL